MSDFVPIDRPQARGIRPGVVATLVVLALLVGILLAGYAMKTGHWPGGIASAPGATPARIVAPPAAGATNGSAAVVAADAMTLTTRAAALAGQVAALEARTAAISADAIAAGGQASRAEGLLIAFAARRSLDRGLGLGYLEEQLRVRFGRSQPQAVTTVIDAARQPVTLEDLRQGLDAIGPELATASNDSWWESVERAVGNLIVLRKAGTPSPLPADRLARARRLLEGGQVEAARAEVARLPGADDAGNWMGAAQRYVVARRALDLIENAAVLGQATQPPSPMPASRTAPATADF